MPISKSTRWLDPPRRRILLTFGVIAVAGLLACCGAPLGPNSPSLGGIVPGAGGGRTGGIALSPFIKPGTVSTVPYNHYSTLRTIEDVFGLGHLGYAARDSVQPFGSDGLTGK